MRKLIYLVKNKIFIDQYLRQIQKFSEKWIINIGKNQTKKIRVSRSANFDEIYNVQDFLNSMHDSTIASDLRISSITLGAVATALSIAGGIFWQKV